MTASTTATDVRDNAENRQFEILVDGELAGLTTYVLRSAVISFLHAALDPSFQGQGLGQELAAAALRSRRQRGLKVLPFCLTSAASSRRIRSSRIWCQNEIGRASALIGGSVRWHGERRSRDSGRAMSQQNVELVRHIYESGLFDRDPEELLRLATADVEYVNPPYAIEPGVRRGFVAVAQAMRRFAELWDESRHELRELYDCGDIVVAAVSWHILSRGSERALVNKEAHTWTLRGGRIARFEWGQDLGKALDAAGGPE
jgi:uncharacterized protein